MEECKYEAKKITLINDDLKKSSSDESVNEADNDSNDDDEKDESNEKFVKSQKR